MDRGSFSALHSGSDFRTWREMIATESLLYHVLTSDLGQVSYPCCLNFLSAK